MCWEILIFEIFALGFHLRNTPRIFSATSTLDADIYTTNQNIEKARHTFTAPDTSLKERSLKLYFYPKLQLLSLLMIYSLLGF